MSAFRFQIGALISLWPMLACAADALSQTPDPAALTNPMARQSLSQLTVTGARPLFTAGRRPFPRQPTFVAQENIPSPPPPPPSFVLVGVLKDGEEMRAVLRAGTTDKAVRVQIGDDVSGWKIVEIERRRVTLSLNDRRTTVTLFENWAYRNDNNMKNPEQSRREFLAKRIMTIGR